MELKKPLQNETRTRKKSQPTTKLTTSIQGASENEVRAYVYQQLAEVENFLPQGSTLAVSLKPNKKGDKVRTIIEVMIPGSRVRGQASSASVFDSIVEAKEDLLDCLYDQADEAAANFDVRDLEVEAVSKRQLLH